MKKFVFGFISGLLFLGLTGVIAETYINSENVSYNNTSSGLSSDNVKGALDNLYERIDIMNSVTASASDVMSGKYFVNSSGELTQGAFTFNGTATASDVASGKTFYGSSGELLSGTLSTNSGKPYAIGSGSSVKGSAYSTINLSIPTESNALFTSSGNTITMLTDVESLTIYGRVYIYVPDQYGNCSGSITRNGTQIKSAGGRINNKGGTITFNMKVTVTDVVAGDVFRFRASDSTFGDSYYGTMQFAVFVDSSNGAGADVDTLMSKISSWS